MFCWTKVSDRLVGVREGVKIHCGLTFQSEIGQWQALGTHTHTGKQRYTQRLRHIYTYKIRTTMKGRGVDVCWRVMHLSKAINTQTHIHTHTRALGYACPCSPVGAKG